MWSLGSAWGGMLFVSRPQLSQSLRACTTLPAPAVVVAASADPKPPSHCEIPPPPGQLCLPAASADPGYASHCEAVVVLSDVVEVGASADPGSPSHCELCASDRTARTSARQPIPALPATARAPFADARKQSPGTALCERWPPHGSAGLAAPRPNLRKWRPAAGLRISERLPGFRHQLASRSVKELWDWPRQTKTALRPKTQSAGRMSL